MKVTYFIKQSDDGRFYVSHTDESGETWGADIEVFDSEAEAEAFRDEVEAEASRTE